MTVTTLDPLTDPRWDAAVRGAQGSLFQSPPWLRVLADTYDFQPQALVKLRPDDSIAAGVLFCQISDMLGDRVVSIPFSDYCDPIVESRDDWDDLMQALLCKSMPIVMRPLHNEIPLQDPRLALTKRARWHGIDLEGDLESHWDRVNSAAKRAIRKARSGGVEIRQSRSLEDVRLFFNLHLGVRKYKYRLLAQPYEFVEQIWARFIEPGNGYLSLACVGDEVIGAVLYLEWGGTLYYKFNASAATDLPHRPNDLLMWTGIEYAKSRGFDRVDLGLSDWDQEGLIRYKQKYATQEKTISFLRFEPEGINPDGTAPIRSMLGELTTLFTEPDVPDAVTERAGDRLYRYFA